MSAHLQENNCFYTEIDAENEDTSLRLCPCLSKTHKNVM